MAKQDMCMHLTEFEIITSSIYECQKCVEIGDTWVHLRVCQECGGVHCCDSSKNKHATKHYNETGHPVVISAEPGEKWAWCYEHEMFIEY